MTKITLCGITVLVLYTYRDADLPDTDESRLGTGWGYHGYSLGTHTSLHVIQGQVSCNIILKYQHLTIDCRSQATKC